MSGWPSARSPRPTFETALLQARQTATGIEGPPSDRVSVTLEPDPAALERFHRLPYSGTRPHAPPEDPRKPDTRARPVEQASHTLLEAQP